MGTSSAQDLRFSSNDAFARLPYFEIGASGRLIADPGVGPIVDVHTHVALSYLAPLKVDLRRLRPRTEHYLSTSTPVDLALYANKNFTARAITRMKRDLTLLCMTPFGMRATHTVPNLLREMDDLGIVRSVLHAIDLPGISDNALAYLQAAAGVPELIVFGSVHPYAADHEGKLDRQRYLGARGIKVHPASQMVRPDNPRSMRLYRLCGERRLPVLWHCGPVDIEPAAGRRRSQVRLYERAIAETPETTFILGHSGALQMELALDLALRYPNVYLDLACQSLGAIRRILEQGPAERILFGSDWPFYHQALTLAKVLIASEGAPELRRSVLHDNAARLLGF